MNLYASAVCARVNSRLAKVKTCKCMHSPIRWITPLKYKNDSLIRHHAPSSNAFPYSQIYTLKAWCFFQFFLVQSPKLNSYLRKRYSLKCWPLRFTYKAPLLIRPVPYKWGIMVYIILFKCSFAACGTKKTQIKVREKYKCVENQEKSKKYTTVCRQILMKIVQAYM